MSSLRSARLGLLAFAFALALVSPAFTGVLPVSPGAADRLVDATSACPTFTWGGVDGAIAYELVVLDVGDAENPLLVYSRRIEGAAFAWAPSREECLAPGRVYAWLVRADVAGSGLGAWSAPRRFRVSGVPSIEEVDAALALLERWRVAQPGVSGPRSGSPASSAAGKPNSASGDRATAATEAPLATGVAAIRGEIPDTTGSAYGVFGITHSAAGAGVVARNEAVGPDLVLDGAAQGEPDTVLTQSGLDRPSAAGATFNFQNSGAGALTLQVDGVAVDTASTPIDWSRLAGVPSGIDDGDDDTTYAAGNQIQLDGTTINVLEGSGSGLDADTFDGLDSGAYAPWPHLHPGEVIASGTVAEAWIAASLARDSEVMPIVLAGDGSGSGLDADTLDGLHATAVQARVTGVCPAGEVMQGINADGTVVCYLWPVPPRINTISASDATSGAHNSLAIGNDGFPVISFYGATHASLLVAKCNDPACSGGDDPVDLIEPGFMPFVGKYNSIAIGNDGFPVISYYDTELGNLKVAKCNDTACTGGNETITTVDDHANDVGQYTSIAIGTDGFPVIGYYDATSGNLKIAKCNDAACTGANETITTVDNSANAVGSYTSLAIGTNGFPVISYYDATDGNLWVAKCNDAACAGANETISVVDASGNVGSYTSIAIGIDGFPVISYFDLTSGSLKVAKCNDAACAGANETRTWVDNPANAVGRYTSIALGTDGFPVVSYLDSSAGALKVVKCNDPACAGADERITTVDSSGDVSDYSSIAIGVDGFPVISYYNVLTHSLTVAKCMSPSCWY